jgi:N-acetylglucosamine kinase-like BadF-type ATPase
MVKAGAGAKAGNRTDAFAGTEELVVGVDGGGTKTIALAADKHGRILGSARGAGSNWAGVDVEIPMAVVARTVRSALENAGLPGGCAALGVFTLAGADWPEDHKRRQEALEKERIACKIIVKNDSFGGLRAGTRRQYGIVIAAGTGVNAAVITPDGQEWAFGYYETYGGAGDLAREAYVAVLRAADGRGRPTSLTWRMLQKLGYPSVEAMLRDQVLGKIERSHVLAFCPEIFEAAAEGDEIAQQIIVKQGQALAEYAGTLIRRFGLQDLELDVVLAGSVFKGEGPLLADTITQAVQAAAPRACVVRAHFEPAVGSLLLAYDALGIETSPELLANLERTLPGTDLFSTTGGGGPSNPWRGVRS